MAARARERLLVWAARHIGSVLHRGTAGLWEDKKIRSRPRARPASVGHPRGAIHRPLDRCPQDQTECWARKKNEGFISKLWEPPRKRGHL